MAPQKALRDCAPVLELQPDHLLGFCQLSKAHSQYEPLFLNIYNVVMTNSL